MYVCMCVYCMSISVLLHYVRPKYKLPSLIVSYLTIPDNLSPHLNKIVEEVTEWWVTVGGGGVGKSLNDSSVPTEQGIYDWIDTGTI